MSRTLYEPSRAATSHRGSVPVPMVYMCECGVKWSNPTASAWECKCGRQLVKRNGIIHAAMSQASGQMAGHQGAWRTAAL